MKKPKPVSLAQQYPQAVLAVDDVDDPYEGLSFASFGM